MTQAEAAEIATEMTRFIAEASRGLGLRLNPEREHQFHNAVFAQAYEFVPDAATSTVVALSGSEPVGLPLLLAIEERRLYKLSFAPFDFGGDQLPTTFCELQHLDPDSATINVETTYLPNATPPNFVRETVWSFALGPDWTLTINTRFGPEGQSSRDEFFARSLGAALGWKLSAETDS